MTYADAMKCIIDRAPDYFKPAWDGIRRIEAKSPVAESFCQTIIRKALEDDRYDFADDAAKMAALLDRDLARIINAQLAVHGEEREPAEIIRDVLLQAHNPGWAEEERMQSYVKMHGK